MKNLLIWVVANGLFIFLVILPAWQGNTNAILAYQVVAWVMVIFGVLMMLPIMLKLEPKGVRQRMRNIPKWKQYLDGTFDVAIVAIMASVAPAATVAYFISTVCLQTGITHYRKETLTCQTK